MAPTSQLLSVILNMVNIAINASLTATHNRKAFNASYYFRLLVF